MKKMTLALIISAMMTVPVCADLPDTYTSSNPDELNEIDVDSLTEDELKTAYNALRETYSACYQVMLDEHMKNLTGNNEDKEDEEEPSAKTDLWKIKYYVDEFQEPTEDAYITTDEFIEGTFSNSATTNSPLYVMLIIDKNDFCIKLIEYRDSVVKGYYDDGHEFDISMSVDGEKKQMKGMLRDGSDRIVINNLNEGSFYHALESGKEVKLYLKNTTDSSSYLFTIPASTGFADLYDQAFGGW